MGWCHEFGPQIAETCEHPMTAHSDRCECTVCGTVCRGRFAGCGAVWARGPREVAVNAPHLGRDAGSRDPFASKVESDRWRVPLETAATAVHVPLPTPTEPVTPPPVYVAPEPTHEPEPEPAPVPTSRATSPIAAPEPEPEPQPEPASPAIEARDVTLSYAVAHLEALNSRVASLTDGAIVRTEEALLKVAAELERLRTQREIDYTEQAAGIFGAVQTGADALSDFTKVVSEVAEDLRTILSDALKTIGGSDGLAAWVASSSAELTETREEFTASLGRIERDITLLRRRANAEAKEAKAPTKIDDEQVAYIVDAVTESVLAALEANSSGRRGIRR